MQQVLRNNLNKIRTDMVTDEERLTLVEEEIKSLVSLRYVFCRLALMPLGGSMVILEPFWRMDTGNLLLGRLVSHRRKSLCTWRGEALPVRSKKLFKESSCLLFNIQHVL